ncbi:MAG: hypothetical protein DRN81_04895 [Thermoproteota archaeon]|nr:MAG: hypothetical protein DRN81_04895 [Candidatus Korarchaeota archaeon]
MKKIKERDKFLLKKIFARLLHQIYRLHTYITILYDKETSDRLILNFSKKVANLTNLTKGGQYDKDGNNN